MHRCYLHDLRQTILLQVCDTSVQTGSLSYSDDLSSAATVKAVFIFDLGER